MWYCWWLRSHTHTGLTALCPGLPGSAGTRKVKPIWILLKQETVSGSGISWAVCKSAHRSRQITTPAPHHSVFTGRMPFLQPNQQCQSTEGEPTHFNTRYGEVAITGIWVLLMATMTITTTCATLCSSDSSNECICNNNVAKVTSIMRPSGCDIQAVQITNT